MRALAAAVTLAGVAAANACDPPASAGFWANAGVMQACGAALSFYCLEK